MRIICISDTRDYKVGEIYTIEHISMNSDTTWYEIWRSSRLQYQLIDEGIKEKHFIPLSKHRDNQINEILR